MFNEIIRWIESSLKHMKYGDLVITVKVHDGENLNDRKVQDRASQTGQV